MVYNPATDFSALWRNIAGVVSKVEMPTLDLTVDALARAGLFTLSVSATAPVANQNTTAWLQTAVPSNSAEGTLHLWDPVATAYAPATAALFFDLLQASTGQNGVSWWTAAGGAPANTVGNNGDFSLRTDEPGGIYGPKAAGAWPANPLPGTTDIVSSVQLDQTFGTAEGALIIRGPAAWQAFQTGVANTVLIGDGAGTLPQWGALSALMDAVLGSTQGMLLYRDVALWKGLAPGAANQVLASGGAAANPAWAPRTAEFPSGTVMLFQQTAAPTGWTKQTAINDYGLRVTSGAVGVTAGTAFSTVFAQTAVGNTTITTTTMPSHTHSGYVSGGNSNVQSGLGITMQNPMSIGSTGSTGSDGAHTHSVQLALSYVDVIIASKN